MTDALTISDDMLDASAQRPTIHRHSRSVVKLFIPLASIAFATSCTLFQDAGSSTDNVNRKLDKAFWELRNAPETSSQNELEIDHPPAKTIRFDGREVVLGTNDVTQLNADEFWMKLSVLLNAQSQFSASHFIARNVDTAERVLWDRWTTESDAMEVRFLADVASRNVSSSASWNSLLEAAKNNPVAAKRYHSERSKFIEALGFQIPSSNDAEELLAASQQMKHPLVMLDAMRLMATCELAAGRNTWAESLLLQAIDLAKQNQCDSHLADLWLMMSVNLVRSGDLARGATAWERSVVSHTDLHLQATRPLNTGFWVRADRHKPNNSEWPAAARPALMVFAKPIGCRQFSDSPIELVLWCAVANAQLEGGEPQLALVNFKRAEAFTRGEDGMWLKIAQSDCLAALGQTQAAATLLSEPLASRKPVLVAAANAALGSVKLQANAFQQGAQLLHRALADSTLDWPAKTKAEADLALALLIIGETEQGLKSLHAVQRSFEVQGNTASLLQSLENERRLLDHEGKSDASERIRQRILEIESKSALVGRRSSTYDK